MSGENIFFLHVKDMIPTFIESWKITTCFITGWFIHSHA